ncbi:MAG TPA: hypothetical protein VII38_18020 [Polyangia bacterium]|jgi:hypothetical protein
MAKRHYFRPILRLSIFLAVSAAMLVALDWHAARASVVDRLLGLSQRMAPYLDDGRSTELPRRVSINGVGLYVAAGHTDQPPEFVRKWYEDRYAARGDGLEEVTKKMRASGALPPSAPGLNQLAFGNDNRGGVAALDFGDKLSMEGLKARFARFIGSGDLGSIARLRYVYYQKTGHGGTRFLTVWTDEKFKLDQLMPVENRDAVGFDLEGVPRYPGTIRVLSAAELGKAQRIVVYDGPGSPETAEMFYRARMHTLGWMEDETFSSLAAKQGKHALKFGNRAGHEVVLDLASATGQGLTVCAIQTR